MEIKPFTINIPQAALDDLQKRLEHTRWPDGLLANDSDAWAYGVPQSYVQRLAAYWQEGYDWRRWEARINAYPQFTTEIDGQNIHFLHVRSPEPDALPLILTHGWPGTFMEYFDVIAMLTNPTAHGGQASDAFHVVIPSLPGFGFSGPTHEPGWNRDRIARAWITLMHRLGYDAYGAVGNDAGSFISPQVGRFDQDHVVGVHVTQLFSFPSGDPDEFDRLSPEDVQALERLQWFNENKSAFNTLQSQQPQTLAFALQDSPAGLLAWNGQLFGEDVDDDFTLTNLAIYWFTGTSASAARLYYEDAHTQHATEPTTAPTGVAIFANDFRTFRVFAERDHQNLIHWSEFDQGGHNAAHQVPELLAGDVRAFFRELRP